LGKLAERRRISHAAKIPMNIDERTERHEAFTQSIELMHSDSQERRQAVKAALQQDAENIRALARVAERRVSDLET
jgi:predicted transcriptional regulator